MSLASRFEQIQNKISAAAKKSGRKASEVTLVAVGKKILADNLRLAYELGVQHFAENYVQEALQKKNELKNLKIHWHYIGQLQSNKVKQIADEFELVHSVDRLKIAEELAKRSTKPQNILIEVNLANETSKGGCAVGELPQLLARVQKLDQLRLRGLMFMPPLNLTELELRKYYSSARYISSQMSSRVSAPHSLVELSMGTSHDFPLAIEEGATIIRVGTSLFGPRE